MKIKNKKFNYLLYIGGALFVPIVVGSSLAGVYSQNYNEYNKLASIYTILYKEAINTSNYITLDDYIKYMNTINENLTPSQIEIEKMRSLDYYNSIKNSKTVSDKDKAVALLSTELTRVPASKSGFIAGVSILSISLFAMIVLITLWFILNRKNIKKINKSNKSDNYLDENNIDIIK